MRASISVDPWGCIFGALLLLLVPLRWLLAAVLAAILHECFHILAIRLCGKHILSIHIGFGGTTIETNVSGGTQELLCAMSGPFGSLLLLTLCHRFPELALCAGAQGLFNLLPVYPLDGGRALRCLLTMLFPGKADRVGKWVARAVFLLLTVIGIYGAVQLSLGLLPIFLTSFLAFKVILRKKPCKPRQIRVQ